MISVTSAQLDLWISAFFWPFFRILALIATAPFFSGRGIPTSTKVGLAFVLTMVVAPTLGPMPAVPAASGQGLFILTQQLMIGAAMGLAVRVIFSAIETAGHIMDCRWVGVRDVLRPQNSAQIPVLGQFIGLVAMLFFGDRVSDVIRNWWRVSTCCRWASVPCPVGDGIPIAVGGEIFRAGVLLSPVVTVLMMTNVALAVLTRAAPQLNIFAVGFPLTLAIGFIVIALSMGHFLPLFGQLFETAVQMMMKIAQDAAVPALR